MATLHPEALDPEIREAVRDIPDFVFSAETVPMMRQNAVFTPVAAPDIERTELTTEPDGGVSMTMLRPRDAAGDLPVLYWMHGGGTVIGNRYHGRRPVRRLVPLALVRLRQRRVPVGPRSALSRSQSTIATKGCATSLIMRPNCGSTRTASASGAAAQAADWPRLLHCVGATGRTIIWHFNTSNTRCSTTG